MRLFYAVKVTETITAMIADAIQAFPVRNPPWRWIPPENMHITLKFLGEVDERILPDLRRAGAEAAAAARPLRLAYGPFGAFPNLSRPRVIFFEAMEGVGELEKIAAVLERAAVPLGIPRENRPFTAHLTLARIKEPLPRAMVEKLASVPPLPPGAVQTIERVSLMQSHLAPSGATYEEIEGFPLG